MEILEDTTQRVNAFAEKIEDLVPRSCGKIRADEAQPKSAFERAHFDPPKSLVPVALVVWEAVVMTMPAPRFRAITVIGATVLGGVATNENSPSTATT
jgi:hypothetical protein